jgi:hypothetical protein
MTQVGVRPPSFVIKTNTDRELHFSYQRYMENRLREEFGFTGTPIRFAFRKKEKGDPLDEGVAKVRRILDPGEGLKPGRQKEGKPARTGTRQQHRREREPKAAEGGPEGGQVEAVEAPARKVAAKAVTKADAPVKKAASRADMPKPKKAPTGIHAKGPKQARRAAASPKKGKTGPRKGTAPKSGRATARLARAPKKRS